MPMGVGRILGREGTVRIGDLSGKNTEQIKLEVGTVITSNKLLQLEFHHLEQTLNPNFWILRFLRWASL